MFSFVLANFLTFSPCLRFETTDVRNISCQRIIIGVQFPLEEIKTVKKLKFKKFKNSKRFFMNTFVRLLESFFAIDHFFQ